MKILAIGPNPAYQKAVEFAEFAPFEVNRAISLSVSAGGKGIHFARAVNRLRPGTATVAHLLGGETGRAVHTWCAADADQLVGWTATPTRVCTTVLCQKTQRMTELIEPTGTLTAAEAADFREKVLAACTGMDGIALCGTCPAALGSEFYRDAATACGRALLLLDGYRDVENVLATGKVNILKINRTELAALTGTDDPDAGAGIVFNRWGVRWLGMTDGGAAAVLFGREARWRFAVPGLDRLVNPIGAGDTVSAVFMLRLLEGVEPPAAFAAGLAAATASCTSLIGADFTADAAAAIARRIKIVQQLPAEATGP